MIKDRGQIAILTAFLLVATLALLGLSVDFSYWVYSKQKIQDAADLSALAGAQDLPDKTKAETSARLYFEKNYGKSVSNVNITFFNANFGIKVHYRGEVPLLFMSIFGFPSGVIEGKAEAIGIPLSKPIGIIPIAIFNTTPLVYDQLTTIWGDVIEPAKGNFGLIDPTNDHTMQNKDLEEWIRNDYKGQKGMPAAKELVYTNPGLVDGPVSKGFNDRLALGNNYVICPIVDMSKVNGSGQVPIMGFAYFEGVSCVVTTISGHKVMIEIKGYFRQLLDNKGLVDKTAGYYGIKAVRLMK